MAADRPLRVLFVCTDNACLSPLAAGLMALHARDRGMPIDVASAGLEPSDGPFHKTVVWLLANRNVRFGRTASQPLDQALLDGADLVITMTHDQSVALTERFAVGDRPVFVLGDLASTSPRRVDGATATLDPLSRLPEPRSTDARWDVTDPTGEPESVYLRLHVEIDDLVREVVSVLSEDATSDDDAHGLAPVEPIVDLRLERTGRPVRAHPA